MSAVGFEPTISAGERPHTNDLDRAATPFKYIKQYTFRSAEFCIIQTYSNMIVLALEDFSKFPVNLGQLFAFTTVRTGFSPKQETT